jgi:hypothetical protein
MKDELRLPARRWARTWQEGWAGHDKASIIALYAPGAHFQPHPFRPALPVASYLDEVFADEIMAEPFFDEPIVDGFRAAVHWRARTQLRTGPDENLNGVSLLVFDSAGLVKEQHDYWADGSRE